MRARVRHNLGWLRQHQGRYEESADILADALARKQAHLGPVHPDLGSTLQALATSEMALGRLSLAIERLQMALAQEIQFVGEPSDGAATARNELGLALMDAGRFDESDEQFRIGLSDRQVMTPEGSMEMAHLLNNRGWLFEAREDFRAAQASFEQSVRMREALGLTERSIARSRSNLARILVKRGRVDEARALADWIGEALDRINGDVHVERGNWRMLHAEMALARNDPAGAQGWLAGVEGDNRGDGFSPRYWAIRLELARRAGDEDAQMHALEKQAGAMLKTMAVEHPSVALTVLRHAALSGACAMPGVALDVVAARRIVDANLVAEAPGRRWLGARPASGCGQAEAVNRRRGSARLIGHVPGQRRALSGGLFASH